MNDTPNMQQAALQLTEQYGWALFPCLPGDKRPATSNGVHAATTDRERIRRWWGRYPDHNIAVACGPISGGLTVVDVDSDDGEDGLRRLEAEHSKLPATLESLTARGRHVFFRAPADADLRNTVSVLAPKVDTRAGGGYVVLPPSRHPCGQRYHWHVDNPDKLAALPAWLLERIQAPRRGFTGAATDWAALIRGDISDGERNATLTRIVGHLMRRYVSAQVAFEIASAVNIARCQPPLPPDDVATIVNSIAVRERRKRTGQ